MKKLLMVAAVLALLAVPAVVAGCGNVELRGTALTAAEQSTMDALQAVNRSDTMDKPTAKSYLTENFKQWRYFVRAAKKDDAWGPKLAGE